MFCGFFGVGRGGGYLLPWLPIILSNLRAYLRDASGQTMLRAATHRSKLHIKFDEGHQSNQS